MFFLCLIWPQLIHFSGRNTSLIRTIPLLLILPPFVTDGENIFWVPVCNFLHRPEVRKSQSTGSVGWLKHKMWPTTVNNNVSALRKCFHSTLILYLKSRQKLCSKTSEMVDKLDFAVRVEQPAKCIQYSPMSTLGNISSVMRNYLLSTSSLI